MLKNCEKGKKSETVVTYFQSAVLLNFAQKEGNIEKPLVPHRVTESLCFLEGFVAITTQNAYVLLRGT